MTLRFVGGLVVGGSLLAAPASAGGLYLPGSGAVSTSRAGAAVASTSDGEAIAVNPAGLAKTPKGVTITISAAMIQYAMEFTRTGTYDQLDGEDQPYEGQPYRTIVNDPSPPLGIGKMQPVPVIAVIADFGIPNFRAAAGIFAPNAYPFRNMEDGYVFNSTFDRPPPGSRYDILQQDAAVLFPSLAASYRVTDKLDIGARVSWGFADIKSKTTIWAMGGNYSEWIRHDGVIEIDVTDQFVPAFGLGATYRPTDTIELGVNYNSWATVHGKGQISSQNGTDVNLGGEPIVIGPPDGDVFKPRCAAGGTFAAQKACVELELPMSAQIGGRYKFLDGAKEVGDIELNVTWENWSAERVTNYKVVADSVAYVNDMPTLQLRDSIIRHGLKDTFGVRLGGSYGIPVGGDTLVFRGGVAYDTAAAKTGWLRADLDGAARTTMTVGAGYKASWGEINVGGGFIYEGTNTNPGDCNPAGTVSPPAQGCKGTDGKDEPVEEREGLDPVNPTINDNVQAQSPVNQGTFKSSYILLMLGFTKSF